jgi:hypothetical protein
VAAVRIYTDESVDVAVAAGLKRRGVDAWSARDVGNLGLSDEEQLRYASREHAMIFAHLYQTEAKPERLRRQIEKLSIDAKVTHSQ